MKKITFLFLALFFCISVRTFASCSFGYSEIIVQIIPDSWPYETSWSIRELGGTLLDTGNSVGDTLCVASGSCVVFTIYDQYGDGIYAPGGYWIYVDGNLAAHGDNFGYQAQFAIACPAGSFCTSPISLTSFG